MLNQIGAQVKQHQHEAFLFAGHYGVERESQRVKANGQLSQTPLPFAANHPYLKNDFAQAQTELVTDYFGSGQQTLRQLQGLDAVLRRGLATDELLWPLSMPPALPAAAQIKLAAPSAAGLRYRQSLAQKYGVNMQMMAGVHLNFSLSERLMRFLFEVQYHHEFADDYIAFHNAAYLKIAQNYLRYRYVLTYLFGASPLAEANFATTLPQHLVRSLHSSQHYGYANAARQQVSFATVAAYSADLQRLVANGQLQAAREFYSPVRFHGASLDQLTTGGIHYLELRTLDLDPYTTTGLSQTSLDFMQLFLAYLLVTPSLAASQLATGLAQAAAANETVALESPQAVSGLQKQLQAVMQALHRFAQTYHAPAALQTALAAMTARVADYHLTPSYRLSQAVVAGSLQQFALQQAQQFAQAASVTYQLPGYTDLDATTQLLLANAYHRGLEVKLLDPATGMVQLADHIMIQGGVTQLNSQIAGQLSRNKLVSKKILGQAGINVPAGAEYTTVATALADFTDLAKQGLVIKPKISAQGAGITVFQTPPTAAAFATAVTKALATGAAALVENYVPGTVYRFLVINGQVKAVAECTPANVVGDGRQNLAALVAKKNRQAKRGVNLPLRPLLLDDQTAADLQQQGLSLATIPARGNQVNLRLAANFTTGGDAVDVTAEIAAGYRKVAVAVAKALQLQVAGVDIVIENLYQPLDAAHPELATVLGATAQPDLALHAAPFFGTAQPVVPFLLAQLN
ncbi:bifunctional glutamate--cysteine ligase GshA/glutathione synthetase GshB [Loigolactobacillus binensis]|uniref:glutamate--cysteine ligase n=1 Tax=Loigolactobacillus binensis TaxID=2559922 RepID=A0ABW3EEY7_9LACO|nr:bifunctional glutamate--cysteine ligase GshA/glutathione synthetase GshB [Loigolactobacillus binensis]